MKIHNEIKGQNTMLEEPRTLNQSIEQDQGQDLAKQSDKGIEQKQGSLFRKFWNKIVAFGNKHKKLTEFFKYFMVGNFVTIIQFVLLPLFQEIFGRTQLVNIDFNLFGPIGAANAITTIKVSGEVISGLNPYYVFNFTGGAVNTLVQRNFNGISGQYLAHGGLAFFLAMFIPLIIAQIISFFMQRNITFKSNGNIYLQGAYYALATLVITVGSNALYGIYQPWLYSTIGEALGGVVASFLQCCIAFWVLFPVLKLIFPKANNAKQEISK